MHQWHPESWSAPHQAARWDTAIPTTAVSLRACPSCCSPLSQVGLPPIIFKADPYSLTYALPVSLHYTHYPTPDCPGNTTVCCMAFWHGDKQSPRLQLQTLRSNRKIIHLPFKLKRTTVFPEALSLGGVLRRLERMKDNPHICMEQTLC